eukprot:scaffold140221_cov79-Cyclotella_meneghiniana.AAC.2
MRIGTDLLYLYSAVGHRRLSESIMNADVKISMEDYTKSMEPKQLPIMDVRNVASQYHSEHSIVGPFHLETEWTGLEL